MIFPKHKIWNPDFYSWFYNTVSSHLSPECSTPAKNFLPPLYSIFAQIRPNILETPGFL